VNANTVVRNFKLCTGDTTKGVILTPSEKRATRK